MEATSRKTVFVSYVVGTRRGSYISDLVDDALRTLPFERVDARSLRPAGGPIHRWVLRAIAQSAVLVADVTELRPSVMYEVGLGAALGKAVVLLTERPSDVVT